MASARPVADANRDRAADWMAAYRASAVGDATRDAPALWQAMLAEVAEAGEGDLHDLVQRAERLADTIGSGFRQPGGADGLRAPLSPLPLMIDEVAWQGIARGVVQRANLMELVLADIYGARRLIAGGLIPAAVVNGSPRFLRPVIGLGAQRHQLQVYAVDLARDPGGGWRVLADHTRAPVGMGYALENRLALARVLPGLQARLNVERLAPFFSDLRAGIAGSCRRSDPRIALLTPGRLNPSYAEQAHLARYLGLLLVEGEDLATHENKVYLRTIEGLKRVDALWRRVGARLIDPLAFDAGSQIGVAGLIDAIAAGNVAVANMPGSGAVEARAFAAYLPRLALRLTGEELILPGIETHWLGDDGVRAEIMSRLNTMTVAPAFESARAVPITGVRVAGLTPDARAALIEDLARRPLDYVAHLPVARSTLPVLAGDALQPREFTLRVFAARDAGGAWVVMPGGFVQIGDGSASTDAVVVASRPVVPATLMPATDRVAIRRNPGTLPSRVADNLFWLGRYLERADAVLALIRGALGGSTDVDGGASLGPVTAARLDAMLVASGATPSGGTLGQAFGDAAQPSSLASIMAFARDIGAGSRERLSTDVWRLLDTPLPAEGPLSERVAALAERLAALAGLSAENMGRTAGWRFLDLGRRLERAVGACRLVKAFGFGEDPDALALLLDLSGSAISYRQRYPSGLAALAVIDLVALDGGNPRSLAFQADAIAAHLAALPRLADDGMAEAQQTAAAALAAELAALSAAACDVQAMQAVENRLLALSDLIARRYFLRGSEVLRAPGLTLA